MIKHSSMGRRAELGPEWAPSGLVTRKIAQLLTKQDQEDEGNSDPMRLSSDPEGRGPSKPSKPCLYYFPFAGRGELTRLIAAAGGLELNERMSAPDRASFGSPGSMPCLAHGTEKVYKSLPVESYIASIAPNFAQLTETERAVDDMLCKIKGDMLEGFEGILNGIMVDEEKMATVAEDVARIGNRWLPMLESKLPAEGFINSLAFPTAADVAVLNVAKAFIPFGAAYMLGSYDVLAKFPKLAAHVNRVAIYPTVKPYLDASSSMSSDPFSLRLLQPQPGLGRRWTPSKMPAQDCPPSQINEDIGVSFDDLPSARLNVPVKVKGVFESPDADVDDLECENRTVWISPPGETTVHWRPTETSMHRESYNHIIRKNLKMDKQLDKFDVSEAMIRGSSMSRQAQLGPQWTPSGLLCRQIASSKVSGVPLGGYSDSSVASTPLDTPRARSRLGALEFTPRLPSCGEAPISNGRARRNLRALGIVR